MAVPLKPGKADTWKAWTDELKGSRKADFDDMNARNGVTTHAAWLQEAPDGTQLVVVVLDGPLGPASTRPGAPAVGAAEESSGPVD